MGPSSWNIKGLKSIVYIDGTINNPKDVDNYWTRFIFYRNTF